MPNSFDTYRQSSGGGLFPKGVINGTNTAAVTANYGAGAALNASTGVDQSLIKVTTSGAQTAATLATVLSLSGKGSIGFLACASNDATSRTHRMKVTIDGVVIYDATSAAVTSVSLWVIPIGTIVPHINVAAAIFEHLQFNTSLLIEYASSLSETGKTLFGYRYIPR